MTPARNSQTKGARDKLPAEVSRRRNRQHGSDFEKRLVEHLPEAYVYRGKAGDVGIGHPKDPWLMIEAKYRTALVFNQHDELRLILDQVWRYVKEDWPKGMPWAIALTGGRKYRGPSPRGIYYLIPHEQFVRYLELDRAYGHLLDTDD